MNWVAIGALWSAVAVVCGAFGAHGLEDLVPPADLEIWRTGVLYHLIHAPALILYGVAQRRAGRSGAGWCLLLGSAIFSGTLYAIPLGGPRWLGAITPVGGLLLVAGWLLFALEARRARAANRAAE
jgi:uncharacterized membrane protein YgdD (TMEM256/DUF423 family)